MIQVSRKRGQEEILLPIGGNEGRSVHSPLVLQEMPSDGAHTNGVQTCACEISVLCCIKHKDVGESVTTSCALYSHENIMTSIFENVWSLEMFSYYHLEEKFSNPTHRGSHNSVVTSLTCLKMRTLHPC